MLDNKKKEDVKASGASSVPSADEYMNPSKTPSPLAKKAKKRSF